MSTLIERIKAQSKASELQRIEVPEWGPPGKPVIAYFRPATIIDMSEAMKAADNDPMRFHARLVVQKLLDESGKRLFANADGYDLERNAEPAVLLRLSIAMGGERRDAETIEGN